MEEYVKQLIFFLKRAFVDFMCSNKMSSQVGKIDMFKDYFSFIFKPYVLHSIITVHEVYRFIMCIKA